MANDYCSACSELREIDPSLAVNGWTDIEHASFQNDTGLNPSSGNNDCTDLKTLNDCLIGSESEELERVDYCDWKDFTNGLISNIHTMFSAVRSAICGLWTNIHKHDCQIDLLAEGTRLSIGEEPSDGSYVIAGQGVSYLDRSPTTGEAVGSDVSLLYLGGALCRLTAGITFYKNQFTDLDGTVRDGNPQWAKVGKPDWFDELVFEIRIQRSKFPQVLAFYNGIGQEFNAAGFHVIAWVTNAGKYAPGQHGLCDADTGVPLREDGSSGTLIPDGWTSIQVRMTWIDQLITENTDHVLATPYLLMGMKPNIDRAC